MAARFSIATILVLALAAIGCGGGDETTTTSTAQTTTDAHTAVASTGAPASITGTVTETMDAASYTYVQVEADGKQVWAAGPQAAVKVGDTVTIATQMPMVDFHSESLDRTFEVLYFVGGFGNDKAGGHGGTGMGGMGMGGGQHPDLEPGADLDLTGIARAEGGHTVGEIHAQAASLSGQTVKVQGKVVKYLSGIMGRNWVHVRDGSGADGTNDLTVTTDAFAKVGDLVVIEGTLATDKDFGAGYRYSVIVEGATVTTK